MIDIKQGDIVLVQQHSLKNGISLGSYVCEADICPRGVDVPEHVVLTAIDEKGKRGQSVRIFPPHYNNGQIPIVREMPAHSPVFVESFAKINR